jgi:hypothetical protein
MRVVLSLLLFFSSCAHDPVLKREDDTHKSSSIEYCRGQLSGFIKSLDSALPSKPYLAIYTELTRVDNKEALLLHLALNFKGSAKVVFPDKNLSVAVDGSKVLSHNLNLALVESFKSADDIFHNSKFLIKPSSNKNEYLVYKRKYGGFFGDLWGDFALEEPVIYKQPDDKIALVKDSSVDISFDKKTHENFYIWAVPILFLNTSDKKVKLSPVPSQAKLQITVPKFFVDGKEFSFASFVINFDRQKIIEASKNSRPCPSMDMIFRWNRPTLLF